MRIAALLALASTGFLFACGSSGSNTFGDADPNNPGTDSSTGDESPIIDLPDASVETAPPCTGLKCQQVTCSSGKTTLSGTVFAPNGTLPLYNVIVYVPNAPLDPIPSGATCDSCGAQVSGSPIVTTLTDAQGKFVLENVPVGNNIPLVMQIGKWRRQITIPTVAQCVDTPIPAASTRLPKNRTEGNIPKIAVTTGGCDPLACLLPKIGIDASEYSVTSSGPQRVTMYAGSGGSGPSGITSATNLWGSATEMKKFDLAIFSCECSENNGNKTTPQAVQDYVDSGGKLFTSHFHYTWFKNLIPAWQTTANWSGGSGSTPALVDQSFPKGKAMADWLNFQGISPTNVPLTQVTLNAGAVNAPTTRWLYPQSGTTSHYLSFNAPVGKKPDQQCGKAVFGGMHIGSGSVDTSFPAGCSSALTPQEKVLAFLFFDLSACVQDDTKPPVPPNPN
jgi:hypothetical protein